MIVKETEVSPELATKWLEGNAVAGAGRKARELRVQLRKRA